MNKKIGVGLVIAIISIGIVLFTTLNISHPLNSYIGQQGSTTIGLQEVKDIPLSGGANRLDYQSIDYSTNRLFISHLGSNMIHVFDLDKQKIVKDISLTANPYGILAVPSLKEVYVGVGGNNQVAVIDENSLQITKYIQAGDTPDGVAYNAQTKQVFVSNENGGTVSVINAQKNEHTTDISIGSAVGNSHDFAKQNKIYTVGGDDNILAEIDPTTNNVIKKYPLPDCTHPHGFYIDSETSFAFITCDVNNVMVVFDLNSKKILSHYSVGQGPDVLAYDEGLHLLYVAAESGIMTIFEVKKGTIKELYQGFIAPRAHTVAVDQKTHYVYIPLENINGKPVLRLLKPI